MENDISDIAVEKLISDARKGDRTALDQLMASAWITALIDKIAAWASHKFNLDATDIREFLSNAILNNINQIKGNQNRPLTDLLTSWCYRVIRNHAYNEGRHNRVVNRYLDRIAHENTQGTRISASGYAIPLPLRRPADSPDEILLKKEEAPLLNSLRAGLRLKVQEIVVTLPPADFKIACLWSLGLTLKEIAAETDRPLSTVGRHLKQLQKLIIGRIGIQEILDADPELRKGACELIANSLRDMIQRGYFPPRAA